MRDPALAYLWRSDLFRCSGGKSGLKAGLRAYRTVPGFHFLFWTRLAQATKQSLTWKPVHILARVVHKRLKFKYGISFPWETNFGAGFYIGHFGGIVVNSAAVIGKNCNIAHGVTIGQVNRGSKKGVPVIGNGVWIGAGAVVIGRIKIGNDVMIAPNAVVTIDVPDGAVVAGIPARIISYAGTRDYIEFTNY